MLARVLVEVRAALPAYLPAATTVLARAAITHVGTRDGVVRCTPVIVDEMRAVAPPTLRVEPDESVRAGVVIDLATGLQIIASLDALLEREWPRLAALVARIASEAVSGASGTGHNRTEPQVTPASVHAGLPAAGVSDFTFPAHHHDVEPEERS
jgi:hypothetical protein